MAATPAPAQAASGNVAEWPVLDNSHLQEDIERLATFLSQEQNTLLISPGICRELCEDTRISTPTADCKKNNMATA
jgi:hypothetical protein